MLEITQYSIINLMNTIDTDIIIVGGGPAGVAAAITAAKGGAKTVLLERGDFCGA